MSSIETRLERFGAELTDEVVSIPGVALAPDHITGGTKHSGRAISNAATVRNVKNGWMVSSGLKPKAPSDDFILPSARLGLPQKGHFSKVAMPGR